MPRVEKFDKYKAEEKAMQLFWEKGYEATSLTDLTNTLGIGKGSFYNTFKSKRALFDQCINRYKENSILYLKNTLYSENYIEKGVKKFLILNLNLALKDSKNKGCFITNTCTELVTSDDMTKQTISSHYQQMKTILIEYLNKQGQLQLKEAHIKAEIIITFFIGLTVQFKLPIDENQILQSIDTMLGSLFGINP